MGRTYTDFSQLSKGMFRKSEPVVEVKPVPKETSAGGDDALAYFGLSAPEPPSAASDAVAGNDATAALKANLEAVRAESAVLSEARATSTGSSTTPTSAFRSRRRRPTTARH